MNFICFSRCLLTSLCLVSSISYSASTVISDPEPTPMENSGLCPNPDDVVANAIVGQWILDLPANIAINPEFKDMPPELVPIAIFGFRHTDPVNAQHLLDELASNNLCALLTGEIYFPMIGFSQPFILFMNDDGYQVAVRQNEDDQHYTQLKIELATEPERLHFGVGHSEYVILQRSPNGTGTGLTR